MARLRYLGTDPRTRNFVYRRDLNPQQRKVLGRRTWLRSLGTKDEKVAAFRWQQAHEDCEAELAAVQAGAGDQITALAAKQKLVDSGMLIERGRYDWDQMVTASRSKLDLDLATVMQLVKAWSERELYRRGQAIFNDPAYSENEAAFVEECKAVGACGHQCVYLFYNPFMHKIINDIFSLGGVEVPYLHEVLYRMERIVKPEIIAILEAEAKWRNYDFSIIPPPPSIDLSKLKAAPPTDQAISGVADSVHDLLDRYLADVRPVTETQDRLRMIVRRFCESMGGDRPIKELKQSDFMDFRQKLRKYPARLKVAEHARTLDEIIRDERPATACLSESTLVAWFNLLSALFAWAVPAYLPTNPVKGTKPKKPKVSSVKPRESFTDADIRALFTSERFTTARNRKKPSLFWLPLIAAYTGARINEIGQMATVDVAGDAEVPHFVIDDRSNDPDVTKRLKNAASRRLVPIHPRLLELGFLAYWRSVRDKHLFPDLPHLPGQAGCTDAYSKAFSRFMKAIEIKRPQLVFHSFRHTWIDRMRYAEVPREIRMVVTGHAGESVHDDYGNRSSLPRILSHISRADYPDFPTLEPWTS